MSALVWTPRKQWATSYRRDGFGIDAAITKSEAGFSWWIDVLIRATGESVSEYSAQPPALSLVEAKRRAATQIDAMLARLIRARGGA